MIFSPAYCRIMKKKKSNGCFSITVIVYISQYYCVYCICFFNPIKAVLVNMKTILTNPQIFVVDLNLSFFPRTIHNSVNFWKIPIICFWKLHLLSIWVNGHAASGGQVVMTVCLICPLLSQMALTEHRLSDLQYKVPASPIDLCQTLSTLIIRAVCVCVP